MRSLRGAVIIMSIAGVLALPAVVAAEEGWNIRLSGVWTDPDGAESFADDDGDLIKTTADSAFGIGLSFEYGFSDRLGLELGYLGNSDSSFDVNVTEPGSGLSVDFGDDLGFDVLDLSLNIRLTSSEKVELYIGPVIAQFLFDDLRFEALGETIRIGVDDEVGYGLVLGLDVALGEGDWFFSVRGKYFDVELDARDKDDPSEPNTKIDFNPLMVGVGFGYRF